MTLGIATPIIYAKATGKTVGVPGSLAHTMTNDKLSRQAKAKTVLEQTKEYGKDVFGLYGTAVGVGATAALATGCSNKVQAALHSAKKGVATVLDDVILKGAGNLGADMSLKEVIKEIPLFQKFNSLPTAAKAGIVAGMATLSLIAPLYSNIVSAKAGYIEGKNESK